MNVKEEGLGKLAAVLFNWFMEKEREYFLQHNLESENKANGFYPRTVSSLFGKLALSIPRDRKSEFRPAILPQHWQRADSSFQDFILNLVLQSYSPSKIKALLDGLGLPYSPEQIEQLQSKLYLKSKELREYRASRRSLCIVYRCVSLLVQEEDTKRVKKAVIYSCIGIIWRVEKAFMVLMLI